MQFFILKTLKPKNEWFFFLTNNLNYLNIKQSNQGFFRSTFPAPSRKISNGLKRQKNQLCESLEISPFRFKINYQNYLFSHTFKYLNLFNFFVKHKKILSVGNRAARVLNYTHFFYFNNLINFIDTDYPLTGKLISNYEWDFLNKKRWNRFEPQLSFKTNPNVTDFLLSSKTLSDLWLKKFYFNNYFYFLKLNTSYSQLKYLSKLDSFKNKPNTLTWLNTKPYLFLNQISRFETTEDLSIDLFRYYQKFFNLFNRTFYKSQQPFAFSDVFFVTQTDDNDFLYFDSNDENFLSFFSLNNCSFKSFRENNYAKSYKITNRFWEKKLNYYASFTDNEDLLKYYFMKASNSFSIFFKKTRTLKQLKNITHLLQLKLNQTPNHQLKLKKFHYALISDFYNTLPFSFYFDKYIKNVHTVTYKKTTRFVVQTALDWDHTPALLFTDPASICLLDLEPEVPFFTNNFETSFVLDKSGFVYTSSDTTPMSDQSFLMASYKKNNFSFTLGTDLHKFIIRRYLKIQTLNFFDFNTAYYNFLDIDEFEILTSNRSYFNQIKTFSDIFSNQRPLLNRLYERSSAPNWNYLTNGVDYWQNPSVIASLNIKRVKFKPGYSTLWRDARLVLKKILNLKFQYQYKLTRYLSKMLKFLKFKLLLLNEMCLNNVLMKSRLVPDTLYVDFFITKGLIYLNGLNCYNPKFVLYTGDLIQMIVHIKYYIIYKWFLNWSLKKKIKLKNKTRQKNTPARFNDEKIKSFLLPDWILKNKNITEDISKFLEVDYLSLSIIVLYEPFLLSDFNVYNLVMAKQGILNLYNWKYIT